MYYPSSENKGVDQLRGYRQADLRLCFRISSNVGFLTTRLKTLGYFPFKSSKKLIETINLSKVNH